MLSGLPVHIVQRGNNRAPCFFEDQDRHFYLFHLERLLPRSRCSLHAYCLMTNHVHLLVTPAEPVGCARLMKYLGQLHTQYVNRHYGRSGTLWEGMFKSCIVQSEDYLLSCYRYIELNPVRGGLCDEERRSAYTALLGSNLDAKRVDEIRSATNGNFALGDESFKRHLGASLGRRVERGSPGRPASTQEKRGLSLV